MSGDNGAVDQNVFEIRIPGQALEDTFKNASSDPPTKAFEHAVPVTELIRQVTPWQAGAHTPQHGCSTLRTCQEGEEVIEACEGGTIAVLGECAGLIGFEDIESEAAQSGEDARVGPDA
jgi:hypothetical protein